MGVVMGEFFKRLGGGALGIAMFLLMGAYALAMLVAAWMGIDYYWGPFAAGAILFACFLLRLSLPGTVFAFLGALNVWDWPWYGALVFAAPGLAFMAIGVTGQLIGGLFGRRAAS